MVKAQQTKAVIMLALAGRQPMPNVNAALFLRPAQVELLASVDSARVAGDTVKALQAEGIQAQVHLVDPYDLSATWERALALLDKHAGERFVFNVTGGTKMMAIGLYNAALDAELDDRDLSIVYLEPHQNRVLCLSVAGRWRSEPLRVATSISTYLLAHGWQVQEKPRTEGEPAEGVLSAARLIARSVPSNQALCDELRRAGADKPAGEPVRLAEPLDEPVVELLNALAGAGLWHRLARTARGWTLRLCNERAWEFVCGGWLRLYVWDALCATELCDEVSLDALAYDADRAPHPIDVLAARNGRLLGVACVSAAASEDERWRAVDGLATATAQMGAQAALVTTVPIVDGRPTALGLYAQARGVTALTVDDLPHIGARLLQELEGPIRAGW